MSDTNSPWRHIDEQNPHCACTHEPEVYQKGRLPAPAKWMGRLDRTPEPPVLSRTQGNGQAALNKHSQGSQGKGCANSGTQMLARLPSTTTGYQGGH